MDHNSIKNQKIKGDFVNREIYSNVNDLVEYALKKSLEGDTDGPLDYGDIENLQKYPEYFGKHAKFSGGNKDDLDNEIENLQEQLENINPNIPEEEKEILQTELEDEISELENLEQEEQEIFEWWLVSPLLGRHLREKGEPVLPNGPEWYWGRTCTGQAILLDGVISEICEELEILEGQKNEWNV